MDIIAPMTIGELAVTNYRSIRELRIELGTMTVVVGRNGSGKSNLYRSMVLLAAAAEGRLARTLLEEGGMPSVLWAGPRQTRGKRKREPVRMIIEVTLDELHYTLEFGLPKPSRSAFALDPEIKAECVWTMDGRRKVVLAERKASSAWVRDDEGHRETYAAALDPAESMLAQLKDPRRFPVLGALRTAFTQWRFYHHFHSHVQAAARQRQAGVRTPVLASDGSDLGAALQTIREIGFDEDLDRAVDQAFPGSRLEVLHDESAQFEVAMSMPGVLRPLTARELSDGTIRYLCLLAALFSPRPPPFLALNEPETSLHSDLLEPLGVQIARATRRSQVLVCTHAQALADAIASEVPTTHIDLQRNAGATEATVHRP